MYFNSAKRCEVETLGEQVALFEEAIDAKDHVVVDLTNKVRGNLVRGVAIELCVRRGRMCSPLLLPRLLASSGKPALGRLTMHAIYGMGVVTTPS